MKITRVGLCPYQWPLEAPVRGVTHRSGWWVAVELTTGRGHVHLGVGDVACWPGFGAGEVAVRAELASLGQLHGKIIPEQAGAVGQWVEALGWSPEARHGVSLALLDACARRRRISLARLLVDEAGGEGPREIIDLHRQISTASQASQAAAEGVPGLKLKVGGAPLALDMARLIAVRSAAPSCRLRLDANGRWSLAEARDALSRLGPLGVDWVEQPVSGLRELVALAATGPATPIAADECLAEPGALSAALAHEAVAAVVIKPMFVGGPVSALAMARRAAEAGRAVVFTHALESPVGRAGAIQTAAAVGDALDLCGLGPIGDAPTSIAVDDSPGLGLDLDAFVSAHDQAGGWQWWGAA